MRRLEPTWIQSLMVPFNSLGKERGNLGLSLFPQQDKVLRDYAFKRLYTHHLRKLSYISGVKGKNLDRVWVWVSMIQGS